MKSRIFILWFIWTLFGSLLIYGVSASDPKNTPIEIAAMVASVSPLIGFMLALGSPKAFIQFNNWIRKEQNSILYISSGLTLLFALPGLLTMTFNPYTTIILAFLTAAVIHSLKRLENDSFALTWTDVVLWIVLWMPFDFRWSMSLHPLVDYASWSIAISVVAIIGWRGYRNADIGINLVPKFKDIYIALLALIMIMAVVVPPGILTGFLNFKIPETFSVAKLSAHFIGLFLTVALPEELFFRGLLLRGLEPISSKKWVPMVVSSLAFGLMHWNNISGLSMQITYISLASIAGLGYAWAYKKSGNNLLAAILTHTLVDWVWKLILAG
jgi:membrane protease YdiL (CAAX protease family)